MKIKAYLMDTVLQKLILKKTSHFLKIVNVLVVFLRHTLLMLK